METEQEKGIVFIFTSLEVLGKSRAQQGKKKSLIFF